MMIRQLCSSPFFSDGAVIKKNLICGVLNKLRHYVQILKTDCTTYLRNGVKNLYFNYSHKNFLLEII